ncbi:MAG: RNA methyltransferase, partial [Clostridia bacterium]|nr:RNA methyltransferase [Clostridia bacterium]
LSFEKDALSLIKSGDTVGILIGPEGGFEEKEIDLATEKNGKIISLGSRILRTETAAIASVTMCMLYAEMELGEKAE